MAPDLRPVYEGPRISLRHIGESDLQAMQSWGRDLAALEILVPAMRVATTEDFAAALRTYFHQTISCVSVTQSGSVAHGLVSAYDVNLAEGWCFILQYFTPEFQRQLYGAEASIAFFDYLFRNHPFRKIYVDIQGFNSGFLEAGVSLGGLVEEGRFKDHVYHEGRYWDMVRLALYREDWPKLKERANRIFSTIAAADGASGVQEPGGGETAAPKRRKGWLSRLGGSNAASNGAVLQQFIEYWQNGNVDGLVSLFARDAELVNPMMGTVTGKWAIEDLLRNRGRWLGITMKLGGPKTDISWSDPETSGDSAIIRGSAGGEGTIEIAGSFDGEGLLVRLLISGTDGAIASFYLGD